MAINKAEANQISVVPEASESSTSLEVGLFLDLGSGKVLDRRDILNAPAAANAWASNQPDDVDWYLDAHNLRETLEATRQLLAEMYGGDSTVTPVLDEDRETGRWDLLFEMRTAQPRSYQEQSSFLDRYLSRVPRPQEGPTPTLFWDPPQRA